MSAGKGDSPRPVNGKTYRKNYDLINWGRDDSELVDWDFYIPDLAVHEAHKRAIRKFGKMFRRLAQR